MEETTSDLQMTQNFAKTLAHDLGDGISFQKNCTILPCTVGSQWALTKVGTEAYHVYDRRVNQQW